MRRKRFVRRVLICLLALVMVAAVGWYGRKGYKRAAERHSITLARRFLAKQDVRNAVLSVRQALQINPLSLPACAMMAEMQESAGLPTALEWRIRAAQIERNGTTNRLLWAQAAIKLREFKSADAALAGVDETSRGTALYHKLSGALAWNLGQKAEAEKDYREALRLEPGNPATVLNLDTIGLTSTNDEVVSAARSSLAQVATNSALRAIALRYLAADAGAHQLYSKAMEYTTELIHNPVATMEDKINYLQLLHLADSANFAPWLAGMKQEAALSPPTAFALGRWMALTENPTNALRWLESLPETIQTNQPVPLIIADCHIALRDWPGLIALLNEQDWAEMDCFRLAMVALGQRSSLQEMAAQKTWLSALALATHRLDLLSRLAQLSASWGWDGENTQVLKEIALQFPKERWATDQLGNKLYAEGNTRALELLLEKIYAENPTDARLKNNLANICLLRKSDVDKGCRLAREAYDSAPENPFFISTYAYSLLLQDNTDEAVKVVGGLKPEYLEIPSVAAYYGVVEAHSGHTDVARAPLERAAAAKLLPEEKEMVRLAKARL